ncbi:MAG: hypothetical protein NC328_00770 [Muribaculum sp.]|nr:hypothetical protein [Muribaculum sp.]
MEPSEDKLLKYSSGTILSILAMKYAFWPLIATITVFLALLSIGIFVDLRWIIVALMIICIIAPMIAAFLYIWHALKPVTAINTLPHSIRETPDSLIITVHLPPFREDNDTDTDERTENSPVRIISFSKTEISSYESWGATQIIHFSDKGMLLR